MRLLTTFSAVLAAAQGIHAARLALSERAASASGVDQAFLQGMDNAGLVETGCWVALSGTVNSTMSSCIALPCLLNLFTSDGSPASSSDIQTWLTGACKSGSSPLKCTRDDVNNWNSLLQSTCNQKDANKPLIMALRKTFSDYDLIYSTYMTLACSLVETETSTQCLPGLLTSNSVFSTANWFMNLVAGKASTGDQAQAFKQAPCNNCSYQMYKAAHWALPQTDGTDAQKCLASTLGQCSTSDATWTDVNDGQKPRTIQLQVVAPETTGSSGTSATHTSASLPQFRFGVLCWLVPLGTMVYLAPS